MRRHDDYINIVLFVDLCGGSAVNSLFHTAYKTRRIVLTTTHLDMSRYPEVHHFFLSLSLILNPSLVRLMKPSTVITMTATPRALLRRTHMMPNQTHMTDSLTLKTRSTQTHSRLLPLYSTHLHHHRLSILHTMPTVLPLPTRDRLRPSHIRPLHLTHASHSQAGS